MVRAKTIECFSSMDHSCPAKKNKQTRTVKKRLGIWLRSDSSRTKLLVRIQAWPYHWTWSKIYKKKTHLKISRKDKYLQQRRLALSVPWRYFFLFKAKEHMALKIQNDHVTSSMTGLLSVILRPTGYWMPHDLYWFTCSFPPSPA